MSDAKREKLRDETMALFQHGYDGYIKYAYPADELRPLTCGPLFRSRMAKNHGINDLHGNVSLTLLDTLSSLPLLHPTALPSALERISTRVSFDQDAKVQVFEMTIRAMGGLLSTYQYLDGLPDNPREQARILGLDKITREGWLGMKTQPKVTQIDLKRYKDRMLDLAEDLGRRLLPAFKPTSGIPFARVNLRHGLMKGESVETCTAGAGTLILEFSLLSRLTGDDRYEKAAEKAFMALWNRRLDQNLLGNTIGTHGHWFMPGISGVGAGMDSYFEYALKAGIMLGDDTLLDIFHDSYAAIQSFVRTPDGFIYRPVHTRLLQATSPSTIDSLSAFLPAIQVMAGDIPSAIRNHLVFWALWRKHSALPESWCWERREVERAGWPGRPEFIESTYYLYQATKDSFYLRVGERILADLTRRTKTRCGFATITNVLTGELEDRMESFMLSETLKYLYLLFSDTPFSNSAKVYNTEGHPLFMPRHLLKSPSPTHRIIHRGEQLTCPIYQWPTAFSSRNKDRSMGDLGLRVSIEETSGYEYARGLVWGWDDNGVKAEDSKKYIWDGVCSVPNVPKYSFDITLTPSDRDPSPEDSSPSLEKVYQNTSTGDYVIRDIDGLHLGVRWRLDGKGYDISSIGPHRVRTGQQVIVTDPSMKEHLPILKPVSTTIIEQSHTPAEIILRFSLSSASSPMVDQTPRKGNEAESSVILHALGTTAIFGQDFSKPPTDDSWQVGAKPLRLIVPPRSIDGCVPLPLSLSKSPNTRSEGDAEGSQHSIEEERQPFVLMLPRGNCTFAEKAKHAQELGANGVLFIGSPPKTASSSSSEAASQSNLDKKSDESDSAQPEEENQRENENNSESEGLIRPSAEPNETVNFSSLGIIYTEYLVGELLRTVLRNENVSTDRDKVKDREGKEEDSGELGVALLLLEELHQASTTSGFSSVHSQGLTAGEQRAKEGRLGVGEWEILNLLIVDTST
ncbi:uncharacterized protein L203_105341 [Cryptococcus depauperatus CBS 7841]|uniref:alpha-1,2-Mannosidase n=1 Tax=Cryptococcus depauperatus CBS 7841 TaxID=1295531 RepID=A0AAJ8M3Y9_9TREE